MNTVKQLKTSFEIGLSNDYRYLCHITNNKAIIFDMKSWNEVINLKEPKNPSEIKFTNNNKYLLVKNTSGGIWIYRLEDFQLVKKILFKKPHKLLENGFSITTDNNNILDIVETKQGSQIVLVNITTEDWYVISSFKNSLIDFNQYIASENLHIFTETKVNESTGYQEQQLIKVKENIDNHLEIEEISHSECPYWDSVKFASNIDVYIVVIDKEILVLDKDFNEILKRNYVVQSDFKEETGYFQHLDVSKDGKFIIITYSEYIFIISYEKLNTVQCEKIQYACFAEFAKDDQYLLVGTWDNGYVFENNLL